MYIGFVIGPVSFGAMIDATTSYGPGWLAAAACDAGAAALLPGRQLLHSRTVAREDHPADAASSARRVSTPARCRR
jgi:hypothetical protein